ncbi:hypothetical protein EC968_001524 [Mortierella alpina]|nr:hypothetical protein EC968_001524 [Mortierella alpina]
MEETQSFRLSGKQEIEKIPFSHVGAQDIVFWEDIEILFPEVKYVKNGSVLVNTMRDSNGDRIMPLRIKHYPGVTLDVVVSCSVQHSREQSSTLVLTNTACNAAADERATEALQVLPLPTDPSLSGGVNHVSSTTSAPPPGAHTGNVGSSKAALSFREVVKLASKKAPGADVQVQLQEMNANMTCMMTLQEEMKQLQSLSISQQEEMKQLQLQVLTQQEEMKQLQVKALEQLAVLQKRVQAVLTQTYELHEYPIPRLFIVLPQYPSGWDVLKPFTEMYRLYFLCECGEHTKAAGSNSKISHEIHLAKHEGYEIARPTEFFQQYGPYILTILKMLKFGVSVASVAVPAVAHLVNADALDHVAKGLQHLRECIEPGMNQVISRLEKGSLDDGEPVESFADQMENKEALEGADLRKLETFLKDKDGSKVLGNLYRTVTDKGHVKWVCIDHYRENYNQRAAESFQRVVDAVGGSFNENSGVVKVCLSSRGLAAHFYSALRHAKSVHELDISWDWNCTRSDVELLADALKKSRIPILRVDLRGFQTDFGTKLLSTNARYGALFRVTELSNMKTIHIILPEKFAKHISLLPKTPTHLHKLCFEITSELLTGVELETLAMAIKDNIALTAWNLMYCETKEKGAMALAAVVKTNSTLTTLSLQACVIDESGIEALAEALKMNTTLTTLKLWTKSIGENGARALAEALKTNEILTTLDLRGYLIGENGARAISDALKTNKTLTTLSLDSDSIGDSGAQALAQALETNVTLTTLNLWDESIRNRGAQKLGDVLQASTTLTTLNVNVYDDDYNLHVYPIPGLFIVLPQYPSGWNILEPVAEKYRLYFVCECRLYTDAAGSDSNILRKLHLAKHEGYEIDRPTEFFQHYGPYLLLILKMIKYNFLAVSVAVPAVADLSNAYTLDQAAKGLQHLRDFIEPGMDYVLNKLEESLDGVNLMEIQGTLEDVNLRKLETFLKDRDGSKILGNLYRTVTGRGCVKWVCIDHYREGYNQRAAETFQRAVDAVGGSFNENSGVVKVSLSSRGLAAHFYTALEDARSVHELDISLEWECTRRDVDLLADALKESRIAILRVDLRRLRRDFGTKLSSTEVQCGALIRVIELPDMKTIHIILPKKLAKHMSLLPKTPSHFCTLSFEIETGSLTEEDLGILADALKVNTTLTILNLTSSSVGINGAQALAEALKTNTTLTTLNLAHNSIGDSAARALAVALQTNSSLTILDLGHNSIGDSGAQALAEALQTNRGLMTLVLRSNSIGEDGGLSLAETLKTNTSLTSLDLEDNALSSHMMRVLTDAVKSEKTKKSDT